MKNLRVLSTFEERKLFCNNLWKSSFFKQNQHLSEIKTLVHEFCKFPRFIAEYSDAQLEHAHFYSWFNIVILRDYQNPVIQDLYYLHEMAHMTTMPYDCKLSFSEWKLKMVENELKSSLFSEVQIYDLILGLRKASFNFPIWYDEVPEAIRLNEDYLRSYRKQSMVNPKTEVEKTLYRYNLSNDSWAEIWKKSYPKVEAMMSCFYQICETDIDRAINFFFEEIRNKENKEGIPYAKEAKSFSEIYLKLKKDTGT